MNGKRETLLKLIYISLNLPSSFHPFESPPLGWWRSVLKRNQSEKNKMFTDFSFRPPFSPSSGANFFAFHPPRHGQIYVFIHGAFLIVTHSSSNILEWMAQISGDALLSNKVEEATADITISIIPDVLCIDWDSTTSKSMFCELENFFFPSACSYHRWDHAPPTRKLNKEWRDKFEAISPGKLFFSPLKASA